MTTVHEAAMALCEAVERFFGRCQPETHPLCGCIVCQARALRALCEAFASDPGRYANASKETWTAARALRATLASEPFWRTCPKCGTSVGGEHHCVTPSAPSAPEAKDWLEMNSKAAT